MLESDPDLDLDLHRPLEDSLGDTSRDPLLLQIMSCICWDMRSMATVFSAPRGTITSAYFFVGRQNSSNAGFTRVVYWWRTCSRSLPLSLMSLITRLASLVS